MFNELYQFETELAEFTGAPYAIATDCCTHALEVCFRYFNVKSTQFTYNTYLSVPMLMHKLKIEYTLINDDWYHAGEYQFFNTGIWDSARLLKKNMYRRGCVQCVSFGFNKPLNLNHGGAILLNDKVDYERLSCMVRDGRDLKISPWENQKIFNVGYHYSMRIETAKLGSEKIKTFSGSSNVKHYPDLREIIIADYRNT